MKFGSSQVSISYDHSLQWVLLVQTDAAVKCVKTSFSQNVKELKKLRPRYDITGKSSDHCPITKNL